MREVRIRSELWVEVVLNHAGVKVRALSLNRTGGVEPPPARSYYSAIPTAFPLVPDGFDRDLQRLRGLSFLRERLFAELRLSEDRCTAG